MKHLDYSILERGLIAKILKSNPEWADFDFFRRDSSGDYLVLTFKTKAGTDVDADRRARSISGIITGSWMHSFLGVMSELASDSKVRVIVVPWDSFSIYFDRLILAEKKVNDPEGYNRDVAKLKASLLTGLI